MLPRTGRRRGQRVRVQKQEQVVKQHVCGTICGSTAWIYCLSFESARPTRYSYPCETLTCSRGGEQPHCWSAKDTMTARTRLFKVSLFASYSIPRAVSAASLQGQKWCSRDPKAPDIAGQEVLLVAPPRTLHTLLFCGHNTPPAGHNPPNRAS